MALNFLGLGFSFGAKDLGLTKMQGAVTQNFLKIQDTVESLSKAVSNEMDLVVRSFAPVGRVAKDVYGATLGRVLDPIIAKFVKFKNVMVSLPGNISKKKDVFLSYFAPISPTRTALIAKGIEKVKAVMNTPDKMYKLGQLSAKGLNLVKTSFSAVKLKALDFKGTLAKAGKSIQDKATAIKDKFIAWKESVPTIDEMKDKISDLREKLNDLYDNMQVDRVREFFAAFSAERIHDAVESFSDFTSRGMNLTTSLEAEMQRNSNEARRMGANYGLAGRDLQQFASTAAGMAQGMNISASTAAEATFQFGQAQSELSAIGVTSARSLAGLQEVTGTSSRVLVDSVRQMRREFGFSDEALRLMSTSTVETGQALGDVGGQLEQMPRLLNQMRQRASIAGHALNDMELAQQAVSANQLAVAFRRTGSSVDEARDQAVEMSSTLVESQRNLRNMFGGTEDDLNSFASNMGIAIGDIGETFQMMQQGPSGMVRAMAQMVQAARRDGRVTGQAMQFMGSHLQEAVGPEQADRLMTFFQRADTATLQLMARAPQAARSLGQIGRAGFSSGRTLQESFELAEQGFVSSFRAIGRRHAVAFVRDTTREFSHFNQSLRAITQRGGPMAELVERMSMVHQMGALALIPQTLRPMAAAFGSLGQSILPFLQGLSAIGIKLTAMFGPVGILVGLVALAAFRINQLMKGGKTFGQALNQLSHEVGAFATYAWRALSGFVNRVLDKLATLSDEMLRRASAFDWSAFFGRMFSKARDALRTVAEAVMLLGAHIMQMFIGGFEPDKQKSRIGKIISNVVQSFKAAFHGLGDQLSSHKVGIIKSMIDGLRVGIPVFFTAMAVTMRARALLLLAALRVLPQMIGDALNQAVPYIQQLMPSIGEAMMDGLAVLAREMISFIGLIIQNLPQIIRGIRTMLTGMLNVLQAVVLGLLDGIGHWLEAKFPEYADVIHTVFVGIRSSFEQIFGLLRTIINGVFDAIEWLMGKIREAVHEAPFVWHVIRDAAVETWNSIAATWSSVVAFFSGIMTSVSNTITEDLNLVEQKFNHVKDIAQGAFTGIMDTVHDLFGHSVNTVVGRDMDETVSVVRSATNQIQGEMEAQLFGAVTRALTNAFRSAFSQILKSSNRFFDSEIQAFARMTQTIVSNFARMWQNVLAQTEISVNAINEEVSSITAALDRVAIAMQAARNAQAAAVSVQTATQPSNAPRAISNSPMQTLIEATDNPRWWEQEYKPMVQQMLIMLGTISSNTQNGANRAVPTRPGQSAATVASNRVSRLGMENMLGAGPSGIPPVGGR